MKIAIYLSAALLALTAACTSNPAPNQGTPKPDTAGETITSGIKVAISPTASTINWKGEKPTGSHTGTIGIKEGYLYLDGEDIAAGSVVLDMNAIVCADLKDPADNNDLVGHLKSADFFDVVNYPVATFELTGVTRIVGDPNAPRTIKGKLTLRGKTNPVTFKAKVTVEGNSVTAVSEPFTIDRTQWGITFKSATLASVVKDKAISDNITLQISLKAGS